MRKSIWAIVVTYNRKNLLEKCLDSLLKQTLKPNAILVVDNDSTDGTEQLIEEKFGKERLIKYLKLKENIGGAGGFYEGVRYAFEKGADWFWLMDDDAVADCKALENLVRLSKLDKKSIFGSLAVEEEDRDKLVWTAQFKTNRGFERIERLLECHRNKVVETSEVRPFLGSFISKFLVERIGFPRKDFFIWSDDVEYFTRAKTHGFRFKYVTSSFIYHPKEERVLKRLLFKRIYFIDAAPWKQYYGIRNGVRIQMEYLPKWKTFLVKIPKRIILASLMAFLHKDQRLKRVKYYYKAIFDGIFNRMGKRVEPSS
jgi:GT2 family glycosyltransferase